MTITKFRVGMAALLILGIAALFVTVGAFAQAASETLNCPSGQLGIFDVQEGVNVECVNAPFATLTPIVGATDTPVPPTATPVGPIEPFAGAPLCTVHNDRKAHTLWNENLGCHYNHEHKANPHLVDDIFGTELYAWAGGEISYPWQTFRGADENYPPPPPPGQGDLENEFKHEQYGWSVGRDVGLDDCRTLPLCVTDFRVQYHAIFDSHGATTRIHSFWGEIRACNVDTGQCGILRTGGHHDYGKLKIDNVFIDLPGDPVQLNGATRNHFRNLGSNGTQGYWITATSTRGANPFLGIQVLSKDVWDLIDPADPFTSNLHCPAFDCEQNNSNVRVQQVRIDVPEELAVDGVVNFSGHTDRHGNIVECSEIGTDCVPLEIQGLEPGRYFTFEMSGVHPGGTEFDISPFFEDGSRDWWIEYPN